MKKEKKFVVCVKNPGYSASLDLRKIYQTIPDPSATNKGLLKIIDESKSAYLYPADFFIAIDLPQELINAIKKAA